jgi:triacylglycerol lipase
MVNTPAGLETPAFVFVHGFLGFDYIRILWKKARYFRNLEKHLRDLKYPLYFPQLPAVDTIAERARVLAENLARIQSYRIYLIGHSMGGLDCRYLTHRLDPERRVRCLVTAGTPHHGSPLADWVLERHGLIQWIGRSWLRRALEDLTPGACKRFNQEIPDRQDVHYLSYAGYRPVAEMPPWFRPWTRRLENDSGENDSQVPVQSAQWGEFKGTVRADHLELAGWSFALPDQQAQRPFDHIAFYRRIIAEALATERS